MGRKARDDWSSLYWCEVPIKGHPSISVFLASDDTHDKLGLTESDGGNIVGYCDRKNWAIWIWAGSDKRELADTLLHEVFHATQTFDHDLNCKEEEKAILAIIPKVLDSLKSMGWAIPQLPDGWRSLAAHARWVRHGKGQCA